MWIFGYGSLVWKVDFPYIKKVVGYVKGYERRFWQASIDHRGVPGKPGRVVTLVPAEDSEARVWGIAYQIEETSKTEDSVKQLDDREKRFDKKIAKVWGVAYKIHSKDVAKVTNHLDHREIMGYERVPIDFYPVPDHPLNAEIIEDPSNLSLQDDRMQFNLLAMTSGASTSGSASTDSDSEPHSFRVLMYYGNASNEHYIGPAPIEDMAAQILNSVGPSGKNVEYLYNLVEAMQMICDDAVDGHLRELEAKVRSLENLLTKDIKACSNSELRS